MESEDIKNASDVYLKLSNDAAAKYHATAEMDIDVQKNRNGALDVTYAVFEKPLFTIRVRDEYDMPNYAPELAGANDGNLE